MVRATIVIQVNYKEGSSMEDAEDDKAEFLHKIDNQFIWSVSRNEDLNVDYQVSEVSSYSPTPSDTEHNHFGDMFRPDDCPACKAMQDNKI